MFCHGISFVVTGVVWCTKVGLCLAILRALTVCLAQACIYLHRQTIARREEVGEHKVQRSTLHDTETPDVCFVAGLFVVVSAIHMFVSVSDGTTNK